MRCMPGTSKEIAGKPGTEEVHARHILVDSEAEAKKIIADLKGGARLRGARQAVQQGPRRRTAGRRSRLLQEGRDGAGVRRLPHSPCSPARSRRRRCTASSAGTSFSWWSAGAPNRPLRSGARRTAPEDDPGGRAEGGGEGARVGRSGEVQHRRLADRAPTDTAEPPPAAK